MNKNEDEGIPSNEEIEASGNKGALQRAKNRIGATKRKVSGKAPEEPSIPAPGMIRTSDGRLVPVRRITGDEGVGKPPKRPGKKKT